MSNDFESELDALLNADDEKKNKQAQAQIKAGDEESEFVEKFKEIASTIIKPTLDNIKSLLSQRGRESRIDEQEDSVTHDQKEQKTAVSIYFNVSQDKYVSRLYEYAHVTFYCDKRGKVVQVHESTMSPGRGGHSGSAGSFSIDEVTEDTVKQKVMKVLKEIYG